MKKAPIINIRNRANLYLIVGLIIAHLELLLFVLAKLDVIELPLWAFLCMFYLCIYFLVMHVAEYIKEKLEIILIKLDRLESENHDS